MIFGFAADGAVASDPAKIVGPNACAECHKQEAEAWKGTHHFKTFREMPRKTEANEIAEKNGRAAHQIGELVPELPFHGAAEGQQGGSRSPASPANPATAPVKDWIKVHSGFSGKTEKTETKAEAEARWKLAEFQGDDQAVLALSAGEELL